MMNRRFIMKVLGLILMVMTFTMCKNQTASVPSTPEEALAALIAGNGRYVNEECINPRSDMERVEETAPHQAPFAAVVGCSDSRVPVELLFDQGIGDIFVIRTAGNNVNSEMVMGSVDYAIEHLGVIRNDVSDYVGKTDKLDDAIRHHTHVQVERIMSYPHVTEKVEKGELLVKAAYYDVRTGKVSLLQ